VSNWRRAVVVAFGLVSPSACFRDPQCELPPANDVLSPIDCVWSGHRTGFNLLVTDTTAFVGYYDPERRLTLAQRDRGDTDWTYHKLDVWTGWDSHNGIAMAFDSAGYLHLVGNLHNAPLVYFRSQQPGDVQTMERVDAMASPALEQRMTYPVFMQDADGRLIFKYRDGSSGAGNEIYSTYDVENETWRLLLTTPLVDGEGERNGYFVGPLLGPDRNYHLAWVWRDTPDAATNHDISYARSPDLEHWYRSDGTPLTLPITLSTAEIVDPVPTGAGLINGATKLGFDPAGRVMITYHKFDDRGWTQVYVARRDADRWRTYPVSDWDDFRWEFGGTGSIPLRLAVQGAVAKPPHRVKVSVVRDEQSIDFILDAETLARLDERLVESPTDRMRELVDVPDGMQLYSVVRKTDWPESPKVALVWPSRPQNRDKPTDDIPTPTPLQLMILR